MKALISILVILLVGMGGWYLWSYWDKVNQQKEEAAKAPTLNEQDTGNMVNKLEEELREARKKGPDAVRIWLNKHKNDPAIKSDRLTFIKLDYVVMLTKSDPAEAKALYAELKKDTSSSSLVYRKLQSFEKAFE